MRLIACGEFGVGNNCDGFKPVEWQNGKMSVIQTSHPNQLQSNTYCEDCDETPLIIRSKSAFTRSGIPSCRMKSSMDSKPGISRPKATEKR